TNPALGGSILPTRAAAPAATCSSTTLIRSDLAPSRESSGAAARRLLPNTSSATPTGFHSTQAIFSIGDPPREILGGRELRGQGYPTRHELGAIAPRLPPGDPVPGQPAHPLFEREAGLPQRDVLAEGGVPAGAEREHARRAALHAVLVRGVELG